MVDQLPSKQLVRVRVRISLSTKAYSLTVERTAHNGFAKVQILLGLLGD
jgi:hypothetical protein